MQKVELKKQKRSIFQVKMLLQTGSKFLLFSIKISSKIYCFNPNTILF